MPIGRYKNGHERECVCPDPYDDTKKLWQCGGDLCRKLINLTYFGELNKKEENKDGKE